MSGRGVETCGAMPVLERCGSCGFFGVAGIASGGLPESESRAYQYRQAPLACPSINRAKSLRHSEQKPTNNKSPPLTVPEKLVIVTS